jgi:hypothetical protein
LGEKRGWYVVHRAISAKTLTTRLVDDELIKKPFTSSRAIYKFIKKNLDNEDLYGDNTPMVFDRIKK